MRIRPTGMRCARSRVRRGRGLRPRCHRDIASAYARTRWADRSRRFPAGGRPAGQRQRDCRSSTRGAVHDRASRRPRIPQGRRDATPTGSRLPRSRRRSDSLSDRGRGGTLILIERDGFLFQSPIAWFAQQGRWDISPGYGEFGALPANFESRSRPIACSATPTSFGGGRNGQPLRDANLPGPCHRV